MLNLLVCAVATPANSNSSEDKELAYKEYAQIKADLTKFIVSGDEVHRDGGVELK